MPSTRSRLRNSQSQSSSLDSARAGVSTKQAGEETFESLSTAVLPLAYSIKLATTSDCALSDTQKEEEYLRGQEFLSDGIRRVGDKEGNLGDVVKSRKRRRSNRNVERGEGSADLEKDVLWYTASLRHACSCDLEPLSRSFTPRCPPPASEDLSTIPNQPIPAEVVRLGENILPWHKQDDGYIDLEPELDNLQEFELGWRTCSGVPWTESHVSGRFCEALDQEGDPVEKETPNRSIVLETPANRWLRKGKFKALDRLTPEIGYDTALDTPVKSHNIVLETPYPPIKVAVEVKDVLVDEEISQERIDWEQESKRRKRLWRGLIGKDPGYGQFWDTLPRPHSHANLGALRNLPKPPDYNLFRNYHTVPHPFHPDLQQFARINHCGRVYWLIPIHGPIVVPQLNDDVLTSPIATKETTIPLPSPAIYSTKGVDGVKTRRGRPATVHWHASLLDHFIQSFLLPLRRSRVYGISIVFSGPKPDPFIALIPPAKLQGHAHTDSSSTKSNGLLEQNVPLDNSSNSDSSQPVRVEAGDHMRVYCDAKDALSLRTWLHGVHVDAKATGQPGDVGTGGKGRRLFDKVRLCLIGEQGEVLIVA